MKLSKAIITFSTGYCALANPDVSPKIEKSDKKFFGKDYPWDKRPPVDVLHFKHPYPAVQDSGDFDRDYVKDENSDNGYWKAQTEYDRLRNKLRKQKADVAKAMAKKARAEARLKEAMKKMKVEEEHAAKVAREEAAARRKRQEQEAEKDKQVPGGGAGIGIESAGDSVKETLKKIPGGLASPGAIKVATEETQKAMDDLEDCKKELAEARERLKKLMKDLEEAKKAEAAAQNTYEAAVSKEKAIEHTQEGYDKSVKDEYEEYMDARNAYLKQQAEVAKLEQDIKIAAERVKRMRDGEDSDGGVYNTGGQKSGAAPLVTASSAILLAVISAAAWIMQ